MNLRTRTLPLLALALFCLCCFSGTTAAAAPTDHWVGTWATSPVALPNADGAYGADDATYREIVHVSLGGSSVRIILS
ncbi:MAG: lipolytic protein family, partial [Edaphobacter sp.]|nr:lipolytic protein family [Edaphobacter sp.]